MVICDLLQLFFFYSIGYWCEGVHWKLYALSIPVTKIWILSYEGSMEKVNLQNARLTVKCIQEFLPRLFVMCRPICFNAIRLASRSRTKLQQYFPNVLQKINQALNKPISYLTIKSSCDTTGMYLVPYGLQDNSYSSQDCLNRFYSLYFSL